MAYSKKIAELFQKGRSTITEHLKNLFDSNELDENAVCRNFRHTAEDGKNYTTKYYNIRAITAVGYRVNSQAAISFRKRATEVLHEYIIKGFAMDNERLKHFHHLASNRIAFLHFLNRLNEGMMSITLQCYLRLVFQKFHKTMLM